MQFARDGLTTNLCIVLSFGAMPALKDVLKDLPRAEVERVAAAAGTTMAYLTEQLANGHRKPSVALAKRLVKALGDRVSLADLRPDIYGDRVVA